MYADSAKLGCINLNGICWNGGPFKNCGLTLQKELSLLAIQESWSSAAKIINVAIRVAKSRFSSSLRMLKRLELTSSIFVRTSLACPFTMQAELWSLYSHPFDKHFCRFVQPDRVTKPAHFFFNQISGSGGKRWKNPENRGSQMATILRLRPKENDFIQKGDERPGPPRMIMGSAPQGNVPIKCDFSS